VACTVSAFVLRSFIAEICCVLPLKATLSSRCLCHTGQCAQAQASQLTKRRTARCDFRYSIPKFSFSLFVKFFFSLSNAASTVGIFY
jgi:hypothetical protein